MNGLRPAARVPSIKRGFGLDTITPSVEVDLGLLCRHGKEDDARIESKRTLRRDRLVSTKSGLCKKAVDSFRQKPKNCLLIQSHRGKLSTNFRQGQQTKQSKTEDFFSELKIFTVIFFNQLKIFSIYTC